MKKFILLLFFMYAFIACTSFDPLYLDSELRKAMLSGKVITEEGLPLEGVVIKLDDIQETRSDINGKFLFNYLYFGKHKIITEKEDYLSTTYEFKYSLKNKRAPFLKIKMLSTNFIVNDTFDLLKEKKYQEAEENIKKLETINIDDDIVKYIKSMYLYLTEKYDKALPILEDLRKNDKNNIYYQLTLVEVYEKLGLFEKMVNLCLYIGKNYPKEYSEYTDRAKFISKNKLNQEIKEETKKDYYIESKKEILNKEKKEDIIIKIDENKQTTIKDTEKIKTEDTKVELKKEDNTIKVEQKNENIKKDIIKDQAETETKKNEEIKDQTSDTKNIKSEEIDSSKEIINSENIPVENKENIEEKKEVKEEKKETQKKGGMSEKEYYQKLIEQKRRELQNRNQQQKPNP
jgi:hypothetical protein